MNFKAQQAYCSYCKHHNATNVEKIICDLTNKLPELEEGCEKMDLAVKSTKSLHKDPLNDMNEDFEKGIPSIKKILLFVTFLICIIRFLFEAL